ncbi:MAG TPA: hypothetical protein VHA33_05855 [Candidatus Angelobacter sp.]|nr:hypothetical protein [Candidatus Angelobacter sp.]
MSSLFRVGKSARISSTESPTARLAQHRTCRSGNFEVVFKDGGPITSQAATIDGMKLTASLDSATLQQFYNKAKTKTQAKDGDNRTIKFTMANGAVN